MGYRPENADTGAGEAVRVVGPGDHTASADDVGGDQVSYAGLGEPPHNEDGIEETGELLRRRLVVDGDARWVGVKVVKEADVDVRLLDIKGTMPVQVTRAPIDDHLARLARSGFVGDTVTHDSITEALWNAISKKAQNSPPVQRRQLVLAIDAREFVAVQALAAVLEQFRSRHGKDARELGYVSIWVVGPIVELVRQLDVEPPPG